MADIIQLPPRPETPAKPMSREEFLAEVQEFSELIMRIDKHIHGNVRKMRLMLMLFPLLCGVSASGSILLLQWLSEALK